ncbi:SHOCT domain-containing protein [[Mycobacterium] nativiensis]|uniref:SHOCT domain-containing protein n=1 Tax=[Mycobacterium] nativiensis TaxID=2855503 RepID=A0ABU5XYF2_9MYCO|nr:SHOCT domain-containing protein [Mycolicibacter sp. MYC340]MEB3032923.1 SHOCT domain-containing protein [Mycolicibacter sp. MYC340]
MVIGAIGFVVALTLNAFLFDRYNAYGEVPIPGSGSVQLPAGEVTISLHTRVISSPTGGGLPVPPLSLGVQPPAGAVQPAIEESVGVTTTVNNDSRRRLWRMQVVAAGEYRITTDGQVGGFIAPRLAFGHSSAYGSLVWVFPAVFGIGVVGLIAATWWRRRRRGRPRVKSGYDQGAVLSPDGAGVRIEQLKTITALRDSGALTQQEFEAEKRRILDGR